MIPDKIYIPEELPEMFFAELRKPEGECIEYIRKDALIEWAKEKLEDLKGLLDTDPYKEAYIGKCEAYKEMIDKLNVI